MKKVLIILASLFGLVIVAAIAVPIIFKDDIQSAIDKELDNALNAKVYYDTDAFSLSLFKSFPDLSVTVGNFGIVGNAPFDADTLVAVGEFGLTIDIMSAIKGEQIEILNVSLLDPKIKVLVLEDGSANYDIAKSTGEEEEEVEEESSSALAIKIQGWEIVNGSVLYDDATLPMVADIKGLNHSGSGDFALDVFDMITSTTAESLTIGYDGVEYISNKPLTADITMAMDLANMKFTFKENKAMLSDFGFGFDGWVSMPAEDIDIDITYGGKDINMKSVLSLIPGVYQEYMEGVTAAGNVNFDGFVKGKVTETDLPQVVANFGIANGKINYAEYPIPMEDIQVSAKFDMPTADLRETSFIMDRFHMLLDGEEVSASLIFKDLEDYYWDFKLDGNLDLEKITKVVELEGMSVKGLINAKMQTKGRMSDVDAERYDKLPTSGQMSMKGFVYESPDLPQGIGIAEAEMSFDPEKISLTKFKGNAGKTDLNMDGEITNYLAYALDDTQMLYGKLNYYSALVDANEWMTESEEEVPEDTSALEVIRIPENIDFVLASQIDMIKYDTWELKDFGGKVIIREGAMKFEKAGFDLMDGHFELNGAYETAEALENPLFNFDFGIEGLSIASAYQSFNTVKKLAPMAEKMTGKFSTDFKLNGSLAQDMMPIYEDMQGAGLVNIAQASLKDVKLLSAVSEVSKLKQEDGEVTLKDVLLSMEIKDGRIWVEPFDFKIGGRKATVAGSTGVDGSLNYAMSMDVPSGQVGEALNSVISGFAGIDNAIGQDITMNLGIEGSYDKPKVKLLSAKPTGSGGSSSLKAQLKDQANAELDKQKEEAKAQLEEKKDEVKAEVEEKVDEAKAAAEEKVDETKEELKEEAEEKVDEVKDKAKDAVKDLFGKKKKGGGGL